MALGKVFFEVEVKSNYLLVAGGVLDLAPLDHRMMIGQDDALVR